LAEWAVKVYRGHRNSSCGVDADEWKASVIRLMQRGEFLDKPVKAASIKRYWRESFNAGNDLTIQGG
jgi:hypothetical protein